MTPEDDKLIQDCVVEYAQCTGLPYKVVRWPDKEPGSSSAAEIDAIAEASGGAPLAIEHTRLQSFHGQLADDQQVLRFYAEIERELKEVVPRGISCAVPVRAFKKGFSWKDARSTLADHIRGTAANIPTGITRQSVPGLPFEIVFMNHPDWDHPFRFARLSPDAEVVARELTASMEQAVGHKKARLVEYLTSGCRTMLILESQDQALIGHTDVYKAFLRAERTIDSEHLTDVIYANTGSRDNTYWFCFKGPDSVLDTMNRPNFKLGPKWFHVWEPHL